MREDVARADRAAAVRNAARAWQQAGAISGRTWVAIRAAYPDDRHRVGPAFRVLLFIFTTISMQGAVGFLEALVSAAAGSHALGILAGLWLILGLLNIVLTEYLTGTLRRAESGVEAATSLAAVGFLIAFIGWCSSELIGFKAESAVAATLAVAFFLLGLAARRWGYPIYAGLAVAALLGSFMRLPGGRLAWIALPIAAAPFLTRGATSPDLPPAHRNACTTALGTALLGLYVAVHIGSFDAGLLELIRFDHLSGPYSNLPEVRWLFIAATALVPIVYLAMGVASRRFVLLFVGITTATASLVTLRYYIHFAPLWLVLMASGALLMLVVIALRRLLDSGEGRERHGFTAEPLFDDPSRQRILEAGAAILSLTPEVRSQPEPPKFSGGGGDFGGGGASGAF